MSEQAQPTRNREPAKTREELLDRLAQEQEMNPAAGVRVHDPDLLRPGDVLDLMYGNFDAPRINRFLVNAIRKESDDKGGERTIVSGLEVKTKDFSQYTNNPEKMEEYDRMIGATPKTFRDVAQTANAMATEPAMIPGSETFAEYDAYNIGMSPGSDGQYRPGHIPVLIKTGAGTE